MQDTDGLQQLRQMKLELDEIARCEKTMQILKKRLESEKSSDRQPTPVIRHGEREKAVIRGQIQKRLPKWRRISVSISLLYSTVYILSTVMLFYGMTVKKSGIGEIASLPLALLLTAIWFCTVTSILAPKER